jgi:hypothetical protein
MITWQATRNIFHNFGSNLPVTPALHRTAFGAGVAGRRPSNLPIRKSMEIAYEELNEHHFLTPRQ